VRFEVAMVAVVVQVVGVLVSRTGCGETMLGIRAVKAPSERLLSEGLLWLFVFFHALRAEAFNHASANARADSMSATISAWRAVSAP
jgi:hypothetical protein